MSAAAPLRATAVARTAQAHKPLAPPAVWVAFARQAQWKNWLLLGLLLIIALLVFACVAVARTEPDVVLVDGDGTSHYVRHSVASKALLNFLAEQKSRPPDITVVAFTGRFIRLFYGLNSSTVRDNVSEALGMMDARLKETTEAELTRGRLVERIEALKIRTTLTVEALDVVEQSRTLIHIQARFSRTASSLVDGSSPKSETLVVDLVERVVPRTLARPDALELAELHMARSEAVTPGQTAAPAFAPKGPPDLPGRASVSEQAASPGKEAQQ
jgi:hypothetical protein